MPPRPRAPIVFLMYHELELPDREPRQRGAHARPYLLPVDTFRMQMRLLRSLGLRGLSVSEALQHPREPGVCITFDDGHETDWIAAAPILQEFGFHATSYVTSGFIGTAGCLTADQLRQLDVSGVEIGCHSMTHPFLTQVQNTDLPRELGGARRQIEQILGHPIEHFSVPNGRYDARTLAEAHRAGFRTVANSRPHANSSTTAPYELGRVPVVRDLALVDFADICTGHGLWRRQLADDARRDLRWLLGARGYSALRDAVPIRVAA